MELFGRLMAEELAGEEPGQLGDSHGHFFAVPALSIGSFYAK
jgi:hypothetical protein